MSKVEEIAERLVKELRDKSDKIREVKVNRSGDVSIYRENEFHVKTDKLNKVVELPNFLPARVGRKAIRKIDANIKGGKADSDNPDSVLDAKDYVVNEMLDRAGYPELDVDDLDMTSYNEISGFYWSKIEGTKKKAGAKAES